MRLRVSVLIWEWVFHVLVVSMNTSYIFQIVFLHSLVLLLWFDDRSASTVRAVCVWLVDKRSVDA